MIRKIAPAQANTISASAHCSISRIGTRTTRVIISSAVLSNWPVRKPRICHSFESLLMVSPLGVRSK
jgi:hypothetical protein